MKLKSLLSQEFLAGAPRGEREWVHSHGEGNEQVWHLQPAELPASGVREYDRLRQIIYRHFGGKVAVNHHLLIFIIRL